jgi:hypothetical protein
MKYGQNNREGTDRALSIARQIQESDMGVIEMVYKFKKSEELAMKKLKKFNEEYNGALDEKVVVGTEEVHHADRETTTRTIYSTRKEKIRKEISEQFIKEYANIFQHDVKDNDHFLHKGPQYLGKRKPPNVKIVNPMDPRVEMEIFDVGYKRNVGPATEKEVAEGKPTIVIEPSKKEIKSLDL